jgi:D-3-phosphoglycerate dehydrogenase
MKLLVGFHPDDYPGVRAFERLGACTFLRYDRAYLEANLDGYDVLVPHLFERIDRSLIDGAPSLKIIATPSTGTNHLDLEALDRAGVWVVTLHDDRAFIDEISSTAEMTWLLILACARKLPQLMHRVDIEESWVNTDIRGMELSGKTVGIVGYGRLGKIVARYAQAFRMTVLVHDTDTGQTAGTDTMESVDLNVLLGSSDVISIHTTLNETSRNLIDAQAVALMKPGVILVNTARGEVLESAAVLEGLKNGTIEAVGLDVLNGEFESTELPADPLVAASANDPRIILTPHVGGSTHEAHAKVFGKVAELIECLGVGKQKS